MDKMERIVNSDGEKQENRSLTTLGVGLRTTRRGTRKYVNEAIILPSSEMDTG